MNKLIKFMLMGLCCMVLVACSNSSDETGKDDKSTETETVFFTGTIEEINETNGLVKVEDGEILKSGDKVFVDLSVNQNEQFQVGDKIKVGYDGEVMESYPLQIKTQSVERLK